MNKFLSYGLIETIHQHGLNIGLLPKGHFKINSIRKSRNISTTFFSSKFLYIIWRLSGLVGRAADL